jgi:hypothetical protein
MERDEVLEELRALIDVPLFDVAIDRYLDQIRQESDRGVLILGPTVVEDALRTALIRFNEKAEAAGEPPPATTREIEGTFHQKWQAYSVAHRFLEAALSERVGVFKAIRNAAAHSNDVVTFDLPIFREAMQYVMHPTMTFDDGPLKGRELSITGLPAEILRRSFLAACGATATRIIHSVDQDWAGLHRDRMFRAAQSDLV